MADTATKLPGPVRGRVVVAASHGGRYPAWLVARAGARAAILNDAGIGKDEAGIAALAYGDAIGMAIATVSHMSCRIGDGHDMVTRGVVSGANRLAGAVGVGWGDPCLAAAETLCAAPLPAGTPAPVPEGRRVLSVPGASRVVVLIDSASLVAPEDCGQIVVTGSHGGLIGSTKALALQVDAFAAFYNDAGRGADDWGVMRLPALDERGIAAATVAATSARIGEAGSTYEEGVISATNATARALGVSPGNRCRDVVDMLCRREEKPTWPRTRRSRRQGVRPGSWPPYGDGIFETACAWNGRIFKLDAHIDRALGFSDKRIVWVHIFPNVFPDDLVMGPLWLANAIRTEASLAFIGLGVKPPTPTWGGMIREEFETLLDSPWLAVMPSVAILLVVFAFNLFGDGLRDAVDPKLKDEA